jgi:D-arginine dehydrogenase
VARTVHRIMQHRLAIVGGGIAGLSCAAHAVAAFDVTVLEAEWQPGYHSSGRSAAVCIEAYMNEVVHALTVEGAAWHRAQGARRIGDVTLADASHGAALDDFLRQWQPLCSGMREIAPAEVIARVPILRAEQVHRAVYDEHALALDAHGLVDGFRRRVLAGGGRILNNARVEALERSQGRWTLAAGGHRVEADIVVNAAGAWGDRVAALAGAEPLGLRPLRRTALLVEPGRDIAAWPLIHRIEGGLYFKPEGTQLMISLGDETPSEPCDAQPEELDVALAVDRFQALTTMRVTRPVRTWAGLRTFMPDGIPAVGFDDRIAGFFWLVGQGGFGMQTAPALGRLSAELLAGREPALASRLAPRRTIRAARVPFAS